MFSKCFHNITVTTNRIRIYAWLPLFSDKYSRTVCIDLRIRVRIDINGQPKAMFTFHTVASPVISTDTLNRELLRSIIDFCKNLFYVVCNRTQNLYMGGSGNFLIILQSPDRNLYTDHLHGCRGIIWIC